MNYEIIIATTKDGIIGRPDGSLPFKQREDMLNFKRVTTGHTVVMGWNTYKSLGYKLLPNRTNIIMSRSRKCVDTISSFYALEQLKLPGKVFIIGGASIYNQAFKELNITKIHHTIVDVEYPEADDSWARVNAPELLTQVKESRKGLADKFNQYDYEIRVCDLVGILSND